MKTSAFVIAALFASVQAMESACASSGLSGVTCGPSDVELFATGMNGDEDLGEDITMKGNKFHFNQYENVQLYAEPAAAAAPAAATAAKTVYPEPEKVHTLDPKIAKAHTTFYDKQSLAEPAAAAAPAAATAAKTVYPEPEKVHTLDPKIAKAHTTFYDKQSLAEPETTAATTTTATKYPEPEKVHTLDPKIAKAHTTFYNGQKQALIEIQGIPKNENKDSYTGVKDFPYPGPEQVHTLDPKIAGHRTTFYNKK